MIIELTDDKITLELENKTHLEFTAKEMIHSKKIKKAAQDVVDEFEEMKAMNDNSTFRLIEKIHSLAEILERAN